MYCSKCGKNLDTDNRFCPSCGTLVNGQENNISISKQKTEPKPKKEWSAISARIIEPLLRIGIIIFILLGTLMCVDYLFMTYNLPAYAAPVTPTAIVYISCGICFLSHALPLLIMIFPNKFENKITLITVFVLLIIDALYSFVFPIKQFIETYSYYIIYQYRILEEYNVIPYSYQTDFALIIFELILIILKLICYQLTVIAIFKNKKLLRKILCFLWLGFLALNFYSSILYLNHILSEMYYIMRIATLSENFNNIALCLFMIRTLIKYSTITPNQTISTYGG